MNPYLLLALFSQFIASSSQILLKTSAARKYPNFIRQYLNFLVIGGYGMLAMSMLIEVVCFSRLEYMSVVIIEPIGYIIVMLLSRLFFKERITRRKLLGMTVLLTGIFVFYLA